MRGDALSHRRLEAIPWANRCIACQELLSSARDSAQLAEPPDGAPHGAPRDIVSEWPQFLGLVLMTERLIEEKSKESRAAAAKASSAVG